MHVSTHNKTKMFMKSQQNFNNLAIIFFKIQGGKLKYFGKYSSRKLVLNEILIVNEIQI